MALGLGGRMDTDRLNSYMDGIAESGKSLGGFSNSPDGALHQQNSTSDWLSRKLFSQ